MDNKTILMIEDDPHILTMNESMLTQLSNGVFDFFKAQTLESAKEHLSEKIDLILLDIKLPDGSGLDFVSEIRSKTNAPIIMLSSLRESKQIEIGLLGGGDVYITKPYRMNELYAQITAMLRREEARTVLPLTLVRGSLVLDITSGRAFLEEDDMQLAPKEFSVLHYLLRNEGRHVPYSELYEAVWKQPMAGDANSLYKTVSKLKKKLEADERSVCFIHAERGLGYELLTNT